MTKAKAKTPELEGRGGWPAPGQIETPAPSARRAKPAATKGAKPAQKSNEGQEG